MTKHKLDIFETLDAIDRRDFGFLERQREDARKAFAGVVVLRWASGLNDSEAAMMNTMVVNEFVNNHFFDLYEHPDLQYKLLAATGVGTKRRHVWVTPSKVTRTDQKIRDFLASFWPHANHQELTILLKNFDRQSFRHFVEGSGVDPDKSKDIIDAYDRLNGFEPEKTIKSRKRK